MLLRVSLPFHLTGVLAVSAQTPDAASKTLPPIDFARWSRFIVRDVFAVQPYETVVLVADPSDYLSR
jgi:hypothetical protein